WRRWTAILVGLMGVMIILRPGFDGFDPNALYAVLGMAGLAARDIAVRRIPPTVSTLQLACLGFAALVPTGLALLVLGGQSFGPLAGPPLFFFAAALGIGVVAYYLIVQATRVGDVGFVTPFRYTRLIFALLLGVAFFSERPDVLTLVGAGIVVASGLYTLWREGRLRG
ncbi:MAG: DMT family transporter, partial [Pseudomonadota bacterium]